MCKKLFFYALVLADPQVWVLKSVSGRKKWYWNIFNYLSKNVIGLIFCENTNSNPYNAVSLSRYIFQIYCDIY